MVDGAVSPAVPDRPTRVGPYRIQEVLGEGGMGTVYLAEQQEPVQRRVALKLIKLGMDSKAVVQRFEQERQALALMDHEGIAKVFDCGTSERGQPFFVMELVRGLPIDLFCEQNRLSLPQRLHLLQQVCAAVQHAHQKGVVHRDLKPGNVLVSNDGGRFQVKVIDFGLAKAMGRKLVDASLFTEAGQVVGTPEYMAPEQADPTNQDIDTRADVYSLGVMLYQLLCGELPFSPAELRKAGMLEVQRILREVDPPKPSTKLDSSGASASEVAQTRQLSIGALRKALRSDLDWVVLKALEKDRNRRYETVTALSADLQRFLDHEPLVAGPPSAAYRLQKLVRRHRAPLAAAALVAVALIGGGIGTFVQWRRAELQSEINRGLAERSLAMADSERAAREAAERSAQDARREEQRARESAAIAEAVTEFVQRTLVDSDPNQGGAQDRRVVDAMDEAIRLLEAGEAGLQPAARSRLLATIAVILDGNARSEDALRLAEQSLAVAQSFRQGDHEDVADGLGRVAMCLETLGRSQEALPRFQAALEMHQRLLPGDHTDVAASLNNLASCLDSLGRSAEALPLHESALAMYQRLLEGDHPSVASNLGNLAHCLRNLGRDAEALVRYEAAWAMYRRVFEGNRPEVARSLGNLAACLEALGRAEEALPKFEAALAMLQQCFAGDHPDVALGLNNLAFCLRAVGRVEEALGRFETALAMLHRLHASDHPYLAANLGNVAGCLFQLGRTDEAMPLYESALAMRQRIHGGDHPDVAESMVHIADLLRATRRGEAALPLYESALAMRQRMHTEDHPSVVVAHSDLASCLLSLGRIQQALHHAELAWAMAQRTVPAGHALRASTDALLDRMREADVKARR